MYPRRWQGTIDIKINPNFSDEEMMLKNHFIRNSIYYLIGPYNLSKTIKYWGTEETELINFIYQDLIPNGLNIIQYNQVIKKYEEYLDKT